MKSYRFFITSVFILMGLSYLNGQANFHVELPNRLPTDLQLNNPSSQSYLITTDYLDYDLHGNFKAKTRFSGEYTYSLPGDSICWNNITISSSKKEDSPFSEIEKQDFMENFSYIQDGKILLPDFFENIPQADIRIRNLIWDVAGLYWFAYWNWEKLELNKPYKDSSISNQEMDLAGQGSFENRNVEITWIGVTKMNNETCAVLKYSTMNNPLEVTLENMNMTGRSHYWGEIFVSLEDKEIELATMLEDVITDISFKGQPSNMLGYTVRKITLTKTP